MTKNNKTLNPQDEKIISRYTTQNRLSKNTANLYKIVLTQYTQVTHKTLTQIKEECLNEEDKHTPLHRKQMNEDIIDFQIYLDSQNLQEYTKRTYFFIIISFYKSLNITMPQIPNKYKKNTNPENTDKPLPKKLLRKMINNAGIRDKAVITFAAMTGQAQDEIRTLTIQQVMDAWNTELETPIFTIKEIFDNKDKIIEIDACRLEMFRQKTRKHYYTFLPQEVTELIIDYLYERQHGSNKKLSINDIESPLFVTKRGTPYKRDGIGKIFRSVGERCGFENPEDFEPEIRQLLERKEDTHRIYKGHNVRKYFIQKCELYAGTRDVTSRHVFRGTELADYWVGHSEPSSISSYLQDTSDKFEKMKQQYLQVVPYLSVNTEVKEYDSEEIKEFKRMKQDYADMQDELNELKLYVHLLAERGKIR